MDTMGVDLHKRETQLCVGQADGTIIEQRSTRCGATASPMMSGRSVDPAARRGCRPVARRLPRCEALVRPSQLLRTTDALLTDRQDSRAELSASILQAFLRA